MKFSLKLNEGETSHKLFKHEDTRSGDTHVPEQKFTFSFYPFVPGYMIYLLFVTRSILTEHILSEQLRRMIFITTGRKS